MIIPKTAIRTTIWLLVLLLSLTPVLAAASGGAVMVLQEDMQTVADPDIDPAMDEDFEAIAVSAQFEAALPAKSAILMEQQTGKVLYEMNADEQIPPASVTKIMTLLLTMEAIEKGKIKLEDMVTCSEYANSMGGSQIWFKVGEQLSVNDLLKAVAIASANDASTALGEHIAGSNDGFVKMMNDRAKELGMVNTHFVNANGLDDPAHLTTSRDIAIMSRELMKHEKITEYTTIWMDSLRGGATELVNTNKLVRFYNGATGLKTGTTDGAGSCLSATATRDGLSLISVVMGCPTSNDRFASARGLLDFGFANYQSIAPPPIDGELAPVRVLRGVEESVMPIYDDPGKFVVEKGQEDMLKQEITLVPDLEAPVSKNQVVGKVQVLVNGELTGEYELRAQNEIARMTFPKAFVKLMHAMLRMNRAANPESAQKTPDKAGEKLADKATSDKENGAGTAGPETEAQPPETEDICICGKDKCYCKEIGDICGCTRTE